MIHTAATVTVTCTTGLCVGRQRSSRNSLRHSGGFHGVEFKNWGLSSGRNTDFSPNNCSLSKWCIPLPIGENLYFSTERIRVLTHTQSQYGLGHLNHLHPKLDTLGSRIRDAGRWPERGHWLQLHGTGESTPNQRPIKRGLKRQRCMIGACSPFHKMSGCFTLMNFLILSRSFCSIWDHWWHILES